MSTKQDKMTDNLLFLRISAAVWSNLLRLMGKKNSISLLLTVAESDSFIRSAD